MQESVLVVGQSHVRCLGITGSTIKSSGEKLDFMFQTVSPGPPKIEALLLYMGLMSPEKIVDVITEHANEKILVLLWQGNFHLSEYLILRQPMFDFVYSSEPALPLLRENIIVPEAMVEAAFERPLGDLHHWINKIRARRPDIRRI